MANRMIKIIFISILNFVSRYFFIFFFILNPSIDKGCGEYACVKRAGIDPLTFSTITK